MKRNRSLLLLACFSIFTLASCQQRGVSSDTVNPPVTTDTEPEDSSASSQEGEGSYLIVKQIETKNINEGFSLDDYVSTSDDSSYEVSDHSSNLIVEGHNVFPQEEGNCSITVTSADDEKTLSFNAVSGFRAEMNEVLNSLENNYTYYPFAVQDGYYTGQLDTSNPRLHNERYFLIPDSYSYYGYVLAGDDNYHAFEISELDSPTDQLDVYGGSFGAEGSLSEFSYIDFDISDFDIEKDDDFNQELVSYGTDSAKEILSKVMGLDTESFVDASSNREVAIDTVSLSFTRLSGSDESNTLILRAYGRYQDNMSLVSGLFGYGAVTDIGNSQIPALEEFCNFDIAPSPLELSDISNIITKLAASNYTLYCDCRYMDLAYNELTEDMQSHVYNGKNYYTATSFRQTQTIYNKEDGTSQTNVFTKGYLDKEDGVYEVLYQDSNYVLGDLQEGADTYKDLVTDASGLTLDMFKDANIVPGLFDPDGSADYFIYPLSQNDEASISLAETIYNLVKPGLGTLLREAGYLYQPVKIVVSSSTMDITQRTYFTYNNEDATYFCSVHFQSIGSTNDSVYNSLK